MLYTKNQSSLASPATVVSTATAAASAGGGGSIVVRSGSIVNPNTLPDHHQQPVPTFENSSPPQQQPSQQQHPPAKMVNRLKSLVSKKKKRFQADGFDLDLSYISPRIIAMGFPAERIEGLYRNHIDEVSRFFEMRHKGHYKIYHLCNERDFNEYRFSGPVVRYPFSDHNAPQFEQILALCQDVMAFLKQHPENVVAINCKAGKGRTGVMVCACLMELQEARNAEEALRLYAEKRTRNGQGVTIPSQRRYVQYYSRLFSSALTYEPTPLRLTTIRVEGLPHHLHGVQNFELSISTYENRLSINHNHVFTSAEEVSHSQGNSVTSITATASAIPPVTVANTTIVGAADNNPDFDCHRHSDVTTYQIPCSTHHSDNGSYLIRLDEPVTVFEDFRIKIKAKSGVLTKKIGQCWLNTFFILLNDPATTPTASSTSISPTAVTPIGCCSASDSNSGSGSSSESSASTASSTSSSVRNSPPRFTEVNEELEDGEEEDDEEEELPTLTSNSTLLHSTSPSPPPLSLTIHPSPTDSVVMLRRSSNPFRFATPKGGVSMPSVSIPKKDNGPSSCTSFTKKSSPNTNLLFSSSMSTQLATPLAVRVLELSQSELDAAAKGRGKKGEEFRVLFEFIRETPCSQSASACSSVNFPNPSTSCSSQRPVAMDLEGVEEVVEAEEQIRSTTSLSATYFQDHHHSFHSPAESTTNHTGALVS